MGGELARARAAARSTAPRGVDAAPRGGPGALRLAVGAWIADAPAFGLSSILVAAAIALPLAWAWSEAAKVASRRPARGRAEAIDAHLGLEGRLLAADEFLGLDARGRFQEAAIETRRAAPARGIDVAPERAELGAGRPLVRRGRRALVVASLIAGLEPVRPRGSR